MKAAREWQGINSRKQKESSDITEVDRVRTARRKICSNGCVDHPRGDFQREQAREEDEEEEETKKRRRSDVKSLLSSEGRGHRPDRDLATAPRANAYTHDPPHMCTMYVH